VATLRGGTVSHPEQVTDHMKTLEQRIPELDEEARARARAVVRYLARDEAEQALLREMLGL
jgi:hypothetical protein